MAPGTAGVDVTVARAHGLGVSESKSRLPLGMPYAARASIMTDARAVPIARGPEEHAIHTVCTHWQAGTPSPLRLPGVIVAGAQ